MKPASDSTGSDPVQGLALPNEWKLRVLIKQYRPLFRLLCVTLSTAFGDQMSRGRIRWLARRCLWQGYLSIRDYRKLQRSRARFHSVLNPEPLEALVRSNQGAVIGSLHLGAYMMIPQALGELGVRNSGIVANRTVLNRDGAELLRRAEAYGSRLDLYPTDEPRAVLKAVRAMQSGQLLYVVFDGNAGAASERSQGRNQIDFDFLDMPVRMRISPAYLAAKAQVPILMAVAYRAGLHRRVLEFAEPIPPPAEATPESLRELTLTVFGWIEEQVRRHPEQWEGWYVPSRFWGEAGAAPTATRQMLEDETRRVQALLDRDGAGARCRSDPHRIVLMESNLGPMLYEGPTRRMLRLPPLAMEIVEHGLQHKRLDALVGRHAAQKPELAAEVARLSLAGLVAVEEG